MDTSGSAVRMEDESAERLREAGEMAPDLTMKCIVEASLKGCVLYRSNVLGEHRRREMF